MLEAGLDGAIWGFAVETGTHLLRLITKGVFDRFPDLKMVVGHLGEALPFWMYRLDYMHAATVRSGRYESMKPVKLKPSEYLRRNIWITTSGMAWAPAIMFCRRSSARTGSCTRWTTRTSTPSTRSAGRTTCR